MKKLLMCLVLIPTLFGCTENKRARILGGTATIKVEPGYKVTMATWKGEDLFYFIEKADSGYIPKEKMLIESSSYGIIESKIVFKEQ